ncbi:MAG TPA: M20/M25/M40 family metallo-hydrolase [Steroidobacteraceae bacterium]|nr:M20/M25/M40 family metallo-hydrolase [Steroidobacteraceae bacterium]
MHLRIAAVAFLCTLCFCSQARTLAPTEQLARDIFAELIAIDTTDETGSVTQAAEAMARRLRAAGIPQASIFIGGPHEKRHNLVVRLPASRDASPARGRQPAKPILFIGHLDVVAAPRVDWATEPFQLVEQDGYFYGRGTQDMKGSDAILVANLIRLAQEGYRPQRDIIVALTAGEESFRDNGMKWLTEQQRQLVDAEFVINPDGGGVLMENARAVAVVVDAAEKLYADFRVTTIHPGGPSALPPQDNAIYRLAHALARLDQHRFPVELNPVTRAYFEATAASADEARRKDIAAILAPRPQQDVIDRMSAAVHDNASLRTVCTATRLQAGHANNALPQQAEALINCRILPGHSPEEVRRQLLALFDDSRLQVQYVREFDGKVFDVAPQEVAMPATAPRPDVFDPLRRIAGAMWPGVPIIPAMSVGESDAVWTQAAGMPTYAISGLARDRNDVRAHGKDERIAVDGFYQGLEFLYRYMKALTGGT